MYKEIEEDLGWETKVRESNDYSVLEDIIISCPNCELGLVQVIKVKEEDILSNIKVICPNCKEESFLTKVCGKIYLAGLEGITIVNADTRQVGNIYNTILEVQNDRS